MIRPGAKSLNKPQLICGIDRKLSGLAFLLSVIVGANDGWPAKTTAVALFLGLCAFGRLLTRTDPNAFRVFSKYLQQKSLYDPMKREFFQIQIERVRGEDHRQLSRRARVFRRNLSASSLEREPDNERSVSRFISSSASSALGTRTRSGFDFTILRMSHFDIETVLEAIAW
jgi:type IV secretory pathway TrbD component